MMKKPMKKPAKKPMAKSAARNASDGSELSLKKFGQGCVTDKGRK